MRIRWKLMIMLLVIAIIPLVTAAVIARRAGQQMGREITEDMGTELLAGASRQLEQLADRAILSLLRDRSIIETKVDAQVEAFQRLLVSPSPSEQRVPFAHEFDDPSTLPPSAVPSDAHPRADASGVVSPMMVSFDVPAIRVMPQRTTDATGEIAHLASLRHTFRFLRERHGDLCLWQFASTETGSHVSFPGHGGYPDEYDPRTRSWYQEARDLGALWSTPFIDVTTQQVLLTRAAPLYDATGRFVGVTGIDVPMTRIMEDVSLPDAWRDQAKVAICSLTPNPDTGEPELHIIAQHDYARLEQPWDMPVQIETLGSSDTGAFDLFLEDIREGRTAVHRFDFEGQDSLWTCGPMPAAMDNPRAVDALSLVIVVPHDVVMQAALDAESRVKGRIDQQLQFTAGLLVGVLLTVALVAFVSSRRVTRPLAALARVAGRVAGGDLEARATVSTTDEIGDLADAFNTMVPQLHDRLKLKESLELAMEVQQHLLPETPPTVPGLDVAGRSIYCDETGGDYFDFIHRSDTHDRRLGVVIGDVTGHGIAAALLMTSGRAMLHSHTISAENLAEVMGAMNRQLVADTPMGRFMTFFYLLIDARARSAHWVSAGHDPALVYDPATDAFTELEGMDVPLGVDDQWTFESASREGFTPGQVIVLGTDGIWEARNDDGKLYGKDPLKASIRRAASGTADAVADAIIADLEAYRGNCPQGDDVTLQVVKFVA